MGMRGIEVMPLSVSVVGDHQVAGRYADLTLLLGLTCLRFGELRGLRVRDLLVVPYLAVPGPGGNAIGTAVGTDRPDDRAIHDQDRTGPNGAAH